MGVDVRFWQYQKKEVLRCNIKEDFKAGRKIRKAPCIFSDDYLKK